MTALVVTTNNRRPDDAYAALLAAHEGLSDEDSAAMNARLILILMNHIGDDDVLATALTLARQSGAARRQAV